MRQPREESRALAAAAAAASRHWLPELRLSSRPGFVASQQAGETLRLSVRLPSSYRAADCLLHGCRWLSGNSRGRPKGELSLRQRQLWLVCLEQQVNVKVGQLNAHRFYSKQVCVCA